MVDASATNVYKIVSSATPADETVLVDSVSVGNVNSYKFSDVLANHTISAVFAVSTPVSNSNVNLGVWGAWSDTTIPQNVTYVVAKDPNNLPSFRPLILDWYDLRPPQWGSAFNPFRTAADLKATQDKLKALDTSSYWGITVPVCQEYTREFMGAYADADTTWFGETIRSYASYKAAENPTATQDQWNDEMFLRLVRGETTYMQGRGLKCGIANSIDAFVQGFRNRSFSGIGNFFGQPAYNYMLAHVDFYFTYAYSQSVSDSNTWVNPAFQTVNTMLSAATNSPMKFWILTRYWGAGDGWQGANIKDGYALEVPMALNKGWGLFTYYGENWQILLNVASTVRG